jgi:hypothetical protein
MTEGQADEVTGTAIIAVGKVVGTTIPLATEVTSPEETKVARDSAAKAAVGVEETLKGVETAAGVRRVMEMIIISTKKWKSKISMRRTRKISVLLRGLLLGHLTVVEEAIPEETREEVVHRTVAVVVVTPAQTREVAILRTVVVEAIPVQIREVARRFPTAGEEIPETQAGIREEVHRPQEGVVEEDPVGVLEVQVLTGQAVFPCTGITGMTTCSSSSSCNLWFKLCTACRVPSSSVAPCR